MTQQIPKKIQRIMCSEVHPSFHLTLAGLLTFTTLSFTLIHLSDRIVKTQHGQLQGFIVQPTQRRLG